MDEMLHSPIFGVGVLFVVMALSLLIQSLGSSSTSKDKKKK